MAGEVPVFQGYLREDGRATTHNEIRIINTVACVKVPSQRIAEMAARNWGMIWAIRGGVV